MRQFFTVLILTFVSVTAHAEYKADQLRLDLQASDAVDTKSAKALSVQELTADARAEGFIDGVSMMLSAENVVCFPHGVTVGQTNAIILKYLRANPEAWNQAAALAVIRALKSAYQCSR